MSVIEKRPRRQFLKDWVAALQELTWMLFPPICLLCGDLCHPRQSRRLCLRCLGQLKTPPLPLCPQCGRSQVPDPRCGECHSDPPPFTAHRSLYLFEEPLSTLIHRAKGSGDRLAMSALQDLIAPCPPFWPASTVIDLVVPVPALPGDIRRRGLDAADSLAGTVAKRLNLPFSRDLLQKVRAIAQQKSLSRWERKQNVAGAFAVNPRRLARPCAALLLVDDIYTTGATLKACAAALKKAWPDTTIFGLTLAQVEAKTQRCPIRDQFLG